MSVARPAAGTCDFWNALVAVRNGRLAELRRDAVRAVIERHGRAAPGGALEDHQTAAGGVHAIAWESGAAFAPDDAARALADGLGSRDGPGADGAVRGASGRRSGSGLRWRWEPTARWRR